MATDREKEPRRLDVCEADDPGTLPDVDLLGTGLEDMDLDGAIADVAGIPVGWLLEHGLISPAIQSL
jgi:hypothetical protein